MLFLGCNVEGSKRHWTWCVHSSFVVQGINDIGQVKQAPFVFVLLMAASLSGNDFKKNLATLGHFVIIWTAQKLGYQFTDPQKIHQGGHWSVVSDFSARPEGSYGYTPLHEACYLGHEDARCLKVGVAVYGEDFCCAPTKSEKKKRVLELGSWRACRIYWSWLSLGNCDNDPWKF